MGIIGRRLARLEAQQLHKTVPQWQIPLESAVLLKEVARYRAQGDGLPVPPYTQEELECMYAQDAEEAAGRGLVAGLRNEPGWQSEEAQAILAGWAEDARRRVEKARRHTLAEVYGDR